MKTLFSAFIVVLSINSILYSQGDTLIQRQAYYDFVQYYDSSRVTLLFGEIMLIKDQTANINVLPLKLWDPIKNRPMLTYSYQHIADSSGTLFTSTAINDTLQYFWTIEVTKEHTDSLPWLNIPDKIVFYLDVIDSISGGVLTTIDSLGVNPITSRYDFYNNIIRPSDTSIIKRYIIPNTVADAEKIRLSIRVEFYGDTSRASVFRWDFFATSNVSNQAIAIKNFARSVIDTLSKSMVLSGSENDGYKIEILIERRNVVISSILPSEMPSTILVYSITGERVLSIDCYKQYNTVHINDFEPGLYFAVVKADSKIKHFKKFIITE